jgi:hypothetical protein
LGGKLTADFIGEVVVQNVFEINIIEIVSPRVENLEALILDALLTEALDIFNNEIGFTFINVSGVGNIILVDLLVGIADKLSNSLDAR